MQYDRTGLPRFEKVEEEEPHYSMYLWLACAIILFLIWWFW